MESIKSISLALLLTGCVHTSPFIPPEVEPVSVLVDADTMTPCEELPAVVRFESFNQVLELKALETSLYINCSGKTEKLQATLKRLDNVKIIRLVTPTSTSSGGETDTAGTRE